MKVEFFGQVSSNCWKFLALQISGSEPYFLSFVEMIQVDYCNNKMFLKWVQTTSTVLLMFIPTPPEN